MSLRRCVFIFALAFSITAALTPAQQPAWLDKHLSARERAHALVSQMTLEEKATQLEDWATAIPGLGIPDYQTWNEALHGVARAGYATVFPQAIGMAATWDRSMVHSMGDIIADEARAKYNQAQREDNHRIFYGLTFWSPNINIFRDPRWGRGQETYGEDPFLTGRLGIAFVTGVQGDDLEPSQARWPPASISRCTADRSSCVTDSMSIPQRARSRRNLPARFSRHRHRRPRAVGDVRLQLHRRVARLHQQDAAQRAPARRVGIQGLRRLRLRRHRGREPGAQEDARHHALRGPLPRGRHRSLLQHLDARLQHAGRRRPPGPGLGRPCDPGRRTPLHRALPARAVRPARIQSAGQDSLLRQPLPKSIAPSPARPPKKASCC